MARSALLAHLPMGKGSPPPPPPHLAPLRPRFAAAPIMRAHVGVGGFAGAGRGQVGRAAERALAGVGAGRRLANERGAKVSLLLNIT
jgi:hypothetical protein